MPELPEVETIVRRLQPVLQNKTIQNIAAPWLRSIDGSIEIFQQAVQHQAITGIDRRGKYICFHCRNGWIFTVHLRMTGKLLFEPDEKDRKYLRVIFDLGDVMLYFADVRKFGRIKLWSPDLPLLPQLGPEPLDTADVFRVLQNMPSSRAIKTVLLDQQVLAGVGNIYADEALFLAGIHPLKPANKLTKKQKKQLSLLLPDILKQAIQNKGTTLSDYRTPAGLPGENQFHLKVYGKKDEPCPICGNRINRIRINGRSSHYCPGCQPKMNSKKQ